VADLNGEGNQDLILNGAGFKVCVLLGNGDGTFQNPVLYDTGHTIGVEAQDVNRDGKLDLIVSGCQNSCFPQGGFISVLLGNGDGTFRTPVSYSTGEAYSRALLVLDLNGDGTMDMVAYASDLIVFIGNGEGTFLPPHDIPSLRMFCMLDRNWRCEWRRKTRHFSSAGRFIYIWHLSG